MTDCILTGTGKTKWRTSTINKILRNEKYMGDALLQKTYTTDFLTKSVSRTTAPFFNTTSKATMKRSFQGALHAGAGRACPPLVMAVWAT